MNIFIYLLITDIKVQSGITYFVHSNVWIAVKEELRKVKEKNVISWFRWLINSLLCFKFFPYLFFWNIYFDDLLTIWTTKQEPVISDIFLVCFCYSIYFRFFIFFFLFLLRSIWIAFNSAENLMNDRFLLINICFMVLVVKIYINKRKRCAFRSSLMCIVCAIFKMNWNYFYHWV